MTRTVAIVGSGIVGAAIAHTLSRKGFRVAIFEKGLEYPYPHSTQFHERIYLQYDNPVYKLAKDLDTVTVSGDYVWIPHSERHLVVGGSATEWSGITLRMSPKDFRTKTTYGHGEDWPVTYDDLEPYYGRAEAHLGVSGTDADNPFAPRRSRPYPLPPFELGYHDALIADALRARGIVVHTTPQARTRNPYEDRAGCQNFGVCRFCPIGARYSANHHLLGALRTGRCRLHHNVSVRRVLVDGAGRAKGLVYQPNDTSTAKEHAADVIILAAGAVESVRLLLLSTDGGHPNGLGNDEGHVGRHFTFHHLWRGTCHYKSPMYPGRFGGYTAQTHQFLDHPSRGRRGAVKIEFGSQAWEYGQVTKWGTAAEIMAQLEPRLHWRSMLCHAESIPTTEKLVRLSAQRDRLGDPYAHIHYRSSDFDHESYKFARELFESLAEASGSDERAFNEDPDRSYSGGHHMGGCRMGRNARDSVVDPLGRLHGSSNVFVAGTSTFVGTSGGVNPTLTALALALRTADFIADQFPE